MFLMKDLKALWVFCPHNPEIKRTGICGVEQPLKLILFPLLEDCNKED
jgi:hypothetical protein